MRLVKYSTVTLLVGALLEIKYSVHLAKHDFHNSVPLNAFASQEATNAMIAGCKNLEKIYWACFDSVHVVIFGRAQMIRFSQTRNNGRRGVSQVDWPYSSHQLNPALPEDGVDFLCTENLVLYRSFAPPSVWAPNSVFLNIAKALSASATCTRHTINWCKNGSC